MAATTGRGADEVEGTIVFTDIVGFTEFTATRGDAEALELLATQDRLVRGALPDEARIVKELGDGLLLWFGSPVAALQSAFAVDRAFEAESEAAGAPLWLRIGMHHGSVLARGDDLIGHDVNVAARIVDVAAPGEVLVSGRPPAMRRSGLRRRALRGAGTRRHEGHPGTRPAVAGRGRLLSVGIDRCDAVPTDRSGSWRRRRITASAASCRLTA